MCLCFLKLQGSIKVFSQPEVLVPAEVSGFGVKKGLWFVLFPIQDSTTMASTEHGSRFVLSPSHQGAHLGRQQHPG